METKRTEMDEQIDYDSFESIECPECHGMRIGRQYYNGDPPDPCDMCGGYGTIPDYNRPIINRGTGKMNYSTAVMLINPNIKAVRVTYEPDVQGQSLKQRYTFKTLDHSLRKGDYVTIPTDTRHEITVAQVDETDVEVDFDSDIQLKWVIGKVDVEAAKTIKAEELKWIEQLKASEKRKKQEEIKKNLLDMYKDVEMNSLAITNMSNLSSGTPVIEVLPTSDTSNKSE